MRSKFIFSIALIACAFVARSDQPLRKATVDGICYTYVIETNDNRKVAKLLGDEKPEKEGLETFMPCISPIPAELKIPNRVDGLDVEVIGAAAFANATGLKHIAIPDSVQYIDNGAFLSCTNLISVTIPPKVRKIGDFAFINCTGLVSVKLLCDVKTLQMTFARCFNLQRVEFSGKVKRLSATFVGCSNLCSIVGLANVDKISETAFEQKAFSFVPAKEDGVKILEGWLVGFEPVQNATYNIPDGTRFIDGIFHTLPQQSIVNVGDCPDVQLMYWSMRPDKKIGDFCGVFQDCTNLVKLSISRHFETVPPNLCKGCCNLTDAKMWDGYEQLSLDSFIGCTNLLRITLPKLPTVTSKWWNMAIPRIVQNRLYKTELANPAIECLYLADAGKLYDEGEFDLSRASICTEGLKHFINTHPDPNAPKMDVAIKCLLEAAMGLYYVKGKFSSKIVCRESDPCETLRYSIYKALAEVYENPESLSFLAEKYGKSDAPMLAVDLYKRAARSYAKRVVAESIKKCQSTSSEFEPRLTSRDFMMRCVNDIRRLGYKATAEALLAELDRTVTSGEKNGAGPTPSNKTGTGWVVNESYIATCWHVVKNAKKISCEMTNGTILPLSVIAHDAANDIVVLKVKGNFKFTTALPIQSRGVKIADRIFTIGYPLASILGQSQKYTDGTISAVTGLGGDSRFYQVSVPVQPGNSGGALLNESGNVIGLTSSGLNAVKMAQSTGTIPQNVNYAIKVRYLAALLDDNGIEYMTANKANVPSREKAVEKAGKATVLITAQ